MCISSGIELRMASCSAIVPLLASANTEAVTTAAMALAAMDTETASREMVEAKAPRYIKTLLESQDNARVKAALTLVINSSCWENMRDEMIKEGVVEVLCEMLNKDVKLLRGKSRTMVAGLTRDTPHGQMNELVLFALRNFTASKQGAEKVGEHLSNKVLEVFLFVVMEELEKGGEKKTDTTVEVAINHVLSNIGMDSTLIQKMKELKPSLWEVTNLGITKCLENLDERRIAGLSSLFAFIKNTGLSMSEKGDTFTGKLGEMMIHEGGKDVLTGLLKLIMPKNPVFRPNEVEKLEKIGIKYEAPSGKIGEPLVGGDLLILCVEVLLNCAGGREGREYLRSIGTYAVLRELDNEFIAEEDSGSLRSLIDLMISDEEESPEQKEGAETVGTHEDEVAGLD